MTDLFALLGQPRRPWLDAEAVQEAFIAAARDHHPDRMQEETEERREAAQLCYTRLNEARQRLSTHHTRIRHLLELERGHPITDLQTISGDVMEIFGAVGRVCRTADAFLVEQAQTKSPILKVALVEQGEELRSALEAARQSVQVNQQALQDRLMKADALWAASTDPKPGPLLNELEELFRLFSFHDRWLSQLQSRWVRLVA